MSMLTAPIQPSGLLRCLATAIFALLCLALAADLRADTITGTIRDPSGAVVAGARIEINGGDLTKPIGLTTDESGKFAAPNLSSGKYSLRVAKEGFESEHLISEWNAHTASSREDRRLFATHRYKIETDISKNNHLYSLAAVTFGEQVLKFALLPTLRVTRVTDQNGQDLHYIQEDRKEDGSFYAVLDEAPAMGTEHSISVEYVGDKVLYDAGGGSYYVGARESWYPNLNGFGERALYDLTFKVPHSNVVISVGKLEGESNEAGFAMSHWVTPVPVAVAGFNYGKYTKIDFPDTITHYNISGYYLSELPDNLRQFQGGDAGPLWMGTRLISPRSGNGYQGATYGKGAYVLQMLRSLLYADHGSGNRDQAFIDTMHDFMESHHDSSASTESFKAIVEKHMTPQMDLQKNGRLDWFFNEWVYGTQVPRYHFNYEVEQGKEGKVRVRVEITQSEVDENFAMFVPVFADFGQGMVRLGQVAVVGSSTRTAIFGMDRTPKKVVLNAYKDILER